MLFCEGFMAPGLVRMAMLLGDDASLDGVIRRFLEDGGGGRLGVMGDTRSTSAVAECIGIAGDAMSDVPSEMNME